MILSISFLFYFLCVLISSFCINRNQSTFSFVFSFGFFFVSLFTLFIVNLFITETGTFLDFDSSDSALYDYVARRASNDINYLTEWIENTKYSYDDIGGVILPLISYKFFDHFFFSRFLNLILHFSTGYMFLKLGHSKKSRFITLLYIYNPVIIYYVASGLKEVFMCFLLISFFYFSRRGSVRKNIFLVSTFFFRSLLFVKLISFSFFKRKINKIFLLIISVLGISVFLTFATNYLNFILFVSENPEFITDRVPINSFIAFLTGPIPLFKSDMTLYNQLWWSGLIIFNILVINYFYSIFKRKKNALDLIIVISILVLMISGTLWKVRYWIPIFCMIIYQFQYLNLNFSKKATTFYFILLLIANNI